MGSRGVPARYKILFPKSKCTFNDDRRASETRLIKKVGISATRLSVVVFEPLAVVRGMFTSPHASMRASDPPASTMSSGAAGAFHWNSAVLLQMCTLVAGSNVYE